MANGTVAKGPWSSKGLNKEDHQRRKEQTENRYSGSGAKYLDDSLESFVPREGQNKIKVVEPIEIDDLGWYSVEVAFHRNVGFDRSYFLCCSEMSLGPCYHTELQTNELWETDRDQAKAYFPDRRTLMLVLDLLSDQPDLVRKWSCPNGLADEIVNQCHDPDSDTYVNPADPVSGPPVFFTRTGQGLHTKYTGVKIGSQPHPLTDNHANQRKQFSEILIVPDYETVKAAFLNQMPPDSVTEGPPVSAYEEDMAAQAAGQRTTAKYEAEPELEPEQEYAEPEQQYDPAVDRIRSTQAFLATLNRDQLKQIKVKYKSSFEALAFPIYKNTADAEIASQIELGLTNAGMWLSDLGELAEIYPSERVEAEPELEPEPEAPAPTSPPAASVPPATPQTQTKLPNEPPAGSPPAVAGSQDRQKTDVKAALAAAIAKTANNTP